MTKVDKNNPKKENEQPVDQVEEVTETPEETLQEEATETDKLQEMGEKLATLNDKYLRLYSEYENYRKRTNVEKADLLLNGSREMMKAILPVIDDFERALDNMKTEEEGVRLIYNKLIKILEQKGLKAMQVKGEKFDENLHEAITQVPSSSPEQKGLVIDVVEKGYYLNDKVLRYAKVVVAC